MFRKKIYPVYQYYDAVINDNGEQVSTKEALGGQTDKIFVRLDSDFLVDYFDAVSKGNTSYVTYIDDLAQEYTRSKRFPLKSISTLLKVYDSASRRPYHEDIGSRIGNMLGVPVVYNRAYKCGSVIYLMSIDYMKYDKNLSYGTIYPDYTDNKDLLPQYTPNLTLDEWKEFFSKSDLKEKGERLGMTLGQRVELIKSFIPTFFFRKYVLGDSDFGLHNIAITHDKKKDRYYVGANYDMERAFYTQMDEKTFIEAFNKDLRSALRNNPSIIKEFMKRVQDVVANRKIDKEALKNIDSKRYSKKMADRLYQNMEYMCKAYEKMMQSEVTMASYM